LGSFINQELRNSCWCLFQEFPLNPKALSLGELYGEYDLNTNEWTDGVLSSVMRMACAGIQRNMGWGRCLNLLRECGWGWKAPVWETCWEVGAWGSMGRKGRGVSWVPYHPPAAKTRNPMRNGSFLMALWIHCGSRA
jgi:hypothetical protein